MIKKSKAPIVAAIFLIVSTLIYTVHFFKTCPDEILVSFDILWRFRDYSILSGIISIALCCVLLFRKRNFILPALFAGLTVVSLYKFFEERKYFFRSITVDRILSLSLGDWLWLLIGVAFSLAYGLLFVITFATCVQKFDKASIPVLNKMKRFAYNAYCLPAIIMFVIVALRVVQAYYYGTTVEFIFGDYIIFGDLYNKWSFREIIRIFPALLRHCNPRFDVISALLEGVSYFVFAYWIVGRKPREKRSLTHKVGYGADGTGYEVETEYEEAYCGLGKHILLCLFTCGIWQLIWIYRTTKYLNKAPYAVQYNPASKLLLCMFIPYYQIYWFYKHGQRIDAMSRQKKLNSSDMATTCLLLGIFIPFIAYILMQERINCLCMTKTPVEGQKAN